MNITENNQFGGKLTTFSRRTEFTRLADNQLLCRARTEWCYFDVDRNRPTKIPQGLKSAFLPSDIMSG
ncbi:hypothetical protein [Leptolyngbya sp. NM3-A1]|uniref:hypothetical protein n=1 Tax=unclassified Leptolyngbya TaxID=2650499 RepID=UPI0019C5F213|nr:hypothetical protein [Leptolyngbya sp. FACHB-16]